MLIIDLILQVMKNKRILGFSKKEIKDLQQKKFLKLVAYVAEKSPYYQKIIKENNIDIKSCVPEDFPILTKSVCMENFNDIVTDNRITREKLTEFFERSKDPDELFLEKYFATHTSGSSGTVGYYVYTVGEFLEGVITVVRADKVRLLQKIAYIASTRGHFAGITMARSTRRVPLLYKDIKAFDINAPFSETIESLNAMQPTIISGYVFALRKLAEAQRLHKLNIKPVLIQTGGEPLSFVDKDYIQKTFNAPMINIYSCSEHLTIGVGADKLSGMYLMEDNLIFEFYANSVCVTNLYNYTLPLIRYQMSDRLVPTNDDNGLMPFTKIEEIIGRVENTPFFLNDKNEEDFISPLFLISEFDMEGVDKWQILVIDKKSFKFKLQLGSNLSLVERDKILDKVRSKLQAILKEKLMTKVNFDIELVDSLWADPKTGKFKLIVFP